MENKWDNFDIEDDEHKYGQNHNMNYLDIDTNLILNNLYKEKHRYDFHLN